MKDAFRTITHILLRKTLKQISISDQNWEKVRQKILDNEDVQRAQAAIMVHPFHHGAALSPNLVQRPVQLDNFPATCFDYQHHFKDQMDRTAVMTSNKWRICLNLLMMILFIFIWIMLEWVLPSRWIKLG